MRRLRTAALAVLLAPAAWAQDQTTVVPPAPPIVSAPLAPTAPVAPAATPPPGLVQTPAPPAASAPPDNTDTGQTATTDTGQATTNAPAPPEVAPVPDNTWLPGKTATIGVLDEVDGGATQLDIPVGGQAKAGDLQISVQSCVTRPAADIPDTAIYITVQAATGATAPLFRGWMVRSTPGATVVGDAGETFRVIGCS
jgi:hypothetical protein